MKSVFRAALDSFSRTPGSHLTQLCGCRAFRKPS